MANSVKILHYTSKKYKDGTSPIIIQVIINREIKRKVFGAVLSKDWDEVACRIKGSLLKQDKYKKINIKIKEEEARILRLLDDNPGISIDNVFGEYIQESPVTFWQIAEEFYLENLSKNVWTATGIKYAVKKFKDIIQEEGLRLSEINESHLNRFVAACASTLSDLSIKTYLGLLKRINNSALAKVHKQKSSDLANFTFRVKGRKLKTKLTSDELGKLLAVKLKPGSKTEEARDMFMLSIYTRGVRISDIILLKKNQIANGRFLYSMGKTNKSFDIKLVPEAIELVNKYKDRPGDYLFSFYRFTYNKGISDIENDIKRTDHIKSKVAEINTFLKIIAAKAGITKKVSPHIARHTFAKMAIDKIQDTNITMDLLGHSSLAVHQAYIREISRTEELDDAADNIFS